MFASWAITRGKWMRGSGGDGIGRPLAMGDSDSGSEGRYGSGGGLEVEWWGEKIYKDEKGNIGK